MVYKTTTQIIEDLKFIREHLDYEPADTPDDVVTKCEKLSGCLGLAAEITAQSKSKYNLKVQQVIREGTIKVAFSNERTKCFDAEANIEHTLMDMSKRYYEAVLSQLDYYRSRLSLLGKEMDYSKKSA